MWARKIVHNVTNSLNRNYTPHRNNVCSVRSGSFVCPPTPWTSFGMEFGIQPQEAIFNLQSAPFLATHITITVSHCHNQSNNNTRWNTNKNDQITKSCYNNGDCRTRTAMPNLVTPPIIYETSPVSFKSRSFQFPFPYTSWFAHVQYTTWY